MIILATKSCSHRHILENRLNEMKIQYRVQYFEDYPELFEQTQPALVTEYYGG